MNSQNMESSSSKQTSGSITEQLAKIRSLLDAQITQLQVNEARLKELYGSGDASGGESNKGTINSRIDRVEAKVDELMSQQKDEAKKWAANKQKEREATKEIVKMADKSHSDRIAQLHALGEELKASRDHARAELEDMINQK